MTEPRKVGDRVLVCGRTPGTIVSITEPGFGSRRRYYDVKFDDRPGARIPPQTAISVIEEHLEDEPLEAESDMERARR